MKQKTRPSARNYKKQVEVKEPKPHVQLKRVLFQEMIQPPGSNITDCKYIAADNPAYRVEFLKSEENDQGLRGIMIRERGREDGTIVLVPLENIRQLVFEANTPSPAPSQDLTPTEK